jgi:Cytochrome b(N-terminal)/b6/petB
MLAAYTGTILPDDALSGGSLSVITGALLAIPLIGSYLVFAVFGGAPPGHEIILRDYCQSSPAGTTCRRRYCLMPSSRKKARSAGLNSDASSGAAARPSRNSGLVAA